MRLTFFVAAAMLATSLAAHADTSYTISLMSDPDSSFSGTGSFSLNVAPSTATGSVTDYYAVGNPMNTGNTIDALALAVDGVTFGLGDESAGYTGPMVEFTSGVLTGVGFDGFVFTGSDLYALDSEGLTYSFADVFDSESGTGKIAVTVTSPMSVTPEPSSMVLLGTGMLGLAGVMRRRFA